MRKIKGVSALLLGMGLLAGSLSGCGKKQAQPEELLTEYIELLHQENYGDMYEFLTEEAQETTDKETYVNRYKNIYGGIEAVSYTHLDVYKRQDHFHSACAAG